MRNNSAMGSATHRSRALAYTRPSRSSRSAQPKPTGNQSRSCQNHSLSSDIILQHSRHGQSGQRLLSCNRRGHRRSSCTVIDAKCELTSSEVDLLRKQELRSAGFAYRRTSVIRNRLLPCYYTMYPPSAQCIKQSTGDVFGGVEEAHVRERREPGPTTSFPNYQHRQVLFSHWSALKLCAERPIGSDKALKQKKNKKKNMTVEQKHILVWRMWVMIHSYVLRSPPPPPYPT